VTTGRAPRVAVVGPRRVRTGLGPFLAKHLVAHGAEVPAFLASREETIDEGRAALAAVGVKARGHVDLDALLAADPVDALVIASPHATHRAWLEAAIERGLHVLCEKPLVWGDVSPSSEAQRIVERAEARGVVVFENCPWPYALPAFDALHPTARADGVRTFEMETAPASHEYREMLVDAVSHPISVLQALAPGAPAPLGESPLAQWPKWDADETTRIEIHLLFRRAEGLEPIAARIRLRTAESQPRPLALIVNGARADREVRMEDYAMSLAGDGRRVDLPDPMAALVGDFVRTVRDGESADAASARNRLTLERLFVLEEIVGSFPVE